MESNREFTACDTQPRFGSLTVLHFSTFSSRHVSFASRVTKSLASSATSRKCSARALMRALYRNAAFAKFFFFFFFSFFFLNFFFFS